MPDALSALDGVVHGIGGTFGGVRVVMASAHRAAPTLMMSEESKPTILLQEFFL